MLPLPLGSYRLPAPQASARRLVNVYAQQAPPERPRGQPVVLNRAPGIAAFSNDDGDEISAATEQRGGIVMGGTLFTVADDTVYSVASTGSATALSGDAISGSGRVGIATNGTDIAILPGDGSGYFCDGSTVTQIADSTFTDGDGCADPAFLDGMFVFRRRNSAQFINTEPGGTTFNALNVATAEGAPDNLVGLIVNHRELILPGETSTERWYNAAQSPGSPFARSPSGFHEQGCAAGNSIANQDNSVFMLANDRTFRRLASAWQQVSHHGIEAALQRMSVVSDCIAIPYRQEGHHFIAFTFRNAGRTFVLDLNTQEWHERESYVDSVSLGYWRPSFVVEAYGKQIVGDSQSGRLGYLDPDTFEEFGEPQRCSIGFQPVYAQNRIAIHRRFELKVTAGQGTATGQGSNPLCTLHISDDGGNTYRAKPTRELGKMGEYEKRAYWQGLGSSRERVYRVDFSDPVRVMTLDAQLDAVGARV